MYIRICGGHCSFFRVEACASVQLATNGTRHTFHSFVLHIWNMENTSSLPEAKTVNCVDGLISVEKCLILLLSVNLFIAKKITISPVEL